MQKGLRAGRKRKPQKLANLEAENRAENLSGGFKSTTVDTPRQNTRIAEAQQRALRGGQGELRSEKLGSPGQLRKPGFKKLPRPGQGEGTMLTNQPIKGPMAPGDRTPAQERARDRAVTAGMPAQQLKREAGSAGVKGIEGGEYQGHARNQQAGNPRRGQAYEQYNKGGSRYRVYYNNGKRQVVQVQKPLAARAAAAGAGLQRRRRRTGSTART